MHRKSSSLGSIDGGLRTERDDKDDDDDDDDDEETPEGSISWHSAFIIHPQWFCSVRDSSVRTDVKGERRVK